MAAHPSDGPGSGPPALPEQFGPYHVLQRLGQGGMGTVYLARDTRLDRRVALKVCLLSEDPEALERFRREAKAAAALRHPNLCPVYEYDVRDGVPYLVMAYIEGPTLAGRLDERGPLPQREAAQLVRRLALAMHEAHRHGVIHRDLKPSNVALDERGEPVILDFGLARQGAVADARLTRTGWALGTPDYMAPEQVRGDLAAIGPACDVYSLGIILYELLTGDVPFHGPLPALVAQTLFEEPTPPSQKRPDLDPRLEAVCLQALAKEPARRHADMVAFAAALEQAAPGGDTAPTPQAVAPPAAVPPGPRTTPAPEAPRPSPRRRRPKGSAASPSPKTTAPPRGVPPPARPTPSVPDSTGRQPPPLPSRHAPPDTRNKSTAVPHLTQPIQREGPKENRGLTVALAVAVATAVLLVGSLVGWLLWRGRDARERPLGDRAATSAARTGQGTPDTKQTSSPRNAALELFPLPDVLLQRGQSMTLESRLKRQNWDGAIELTTRGLPPGVKAVGGEVAAGASDGRLTLGASLGARPTEWIAHLVARAGEVRVEAPFRLIVGDAMKREITNSVGMRLVLVPAGQFLMGSPKTEKDRKDGEDEHLVEIARPFYMGAYEVTQAEYAKVMELPNPSWFSPEGDGKDKVVGPDTSRFPVEQVSWDEAQKFCEKLSASAKEKMAGRTYRLPTEAEWERACRGGVYPPTPFHVGRPLSSLSSELANFNGGYPAGGAAMGPHRKHPTPVGSFPPNALGLHDMHGNVREWCDDWYSTKVKDRRVVRGGSWDTEGWKCRAACRDGVNPESRKKDLGFRVVSEVSGTD
jgi:formylglycine-generating enzyme required for sulfatase activity/serine/threonine protein kinase